jgi:hypothetical protein
MSLSISDWQHPALLAIYKTEMARFVNILRALGIEFTQTSPADDFDWQAHLQAYGFETDIQKCTVISVNGTDYLFSDEAFASSACFANAGEKAINPNGVYLLARNQQTGEVKPRVCYECPEGTLLPYRGGAALQHAYPLG